MAHDPHNDETLIFVAIESFAGVDFTGTPIQILRGHRMRGGKNSIPAKCPHLFIHDAALGREIMQAREAAGLASY
jgi:hypothetical protein